ncbi:hypothetical protein SO802_030530 [Lithocarpus litseifolius]|uniref:RING-type E3 ubiquitin transferase n=1 Tax=Lithocarpus litseifolius TaxID=425828 RepID=A0AAW2BL95_9ROSI
MADHDEDYAGYLQNVDQLAPLQVDSGSETEEEEDDDDDDEEEEEGEEEEEDEQCKRRRSLLSIYFQAAAWSCSWDLNSSHYIYAGLQNGSLLVFNMHQTDGPVISLKGRSYHPVRTVHSLLHSSTLTSGVRSVLSASSIGLSRWNFDGSETRPFLVPESVNQGICISLSYSPSSDDIVASYRPKVEMQNEMAISQPSITHSQVIGQGVQASHVHYKEVGSNCFQKLGSACANVNESRIPIRSAILDIENQGRMFAYGDEVMRKLILQELPSHEKDNAYGILNEHVAEESKEFIQLQNSVVQPAEEHSGSSLNGGSVAVTLNAVH